MVGFEQCCELGQLMTQHSYIKVANTKLVSQRFFIIKDQLPDICNRVIRLACLRSLLAFVHQDSSVNNLLDQNELV